MTLSAPVCTRATDTPVRADTGTHLWQRFNRECLCVTLDRPALCAAFQAEVGDPVFCTQLQQSHPHLFAATPVFVPQEAIHQMHQAVLAIESVTRLPAYQRQVLAWASKCAQPNFGPAGVFMGYDFHHTPAGPKLIEVNTNAGGAFLNAVLVRAQSACCPQARMHANPWNAPDFDAAVGHMFQQEWALQGRSGKPQRIALVDDEPAAQYLYPEFILARQLLQRQGFQTLIAEASALHYTDGRLFYQDEPIDLIYNRLVDFSFQEPRHAALRLAYLDGAVVVTPNPHLHALFADKRNLSLLSQPSQRTAWGIDSALTQALEAVLHTEVVSEQNAAALWSARKTLFFKPAGGHGSKAVYRGDKLTRGVWSQILQGNYVAQEFSPPGERRIKLDGILATRKIDFRLYAYQGQILLVAARLYQGQTTNFRTPGGGFAPVFTIPTQPATGLPTSPTENPAPLI